MPHDTLQPNLAKDNKLGFFSRLFGKCITQLPTNNECWTFTDGALAIDLSRAPELANLGSAIRIEDESLPERVLLVHGDDDVFRAYKNECVHGKRRIDPVPGAGTLQCCSVNKTTYDYSGTKLRGPVDGELTVYPVAVNEQQLTINLNG